MPIDDYTAASGNNNITDEAFFKLLGVNRIRSMDKSPYEGADMIHNLNDPIPKHLANTVDFILDGSTLDNVWDPATTLRNMARLLRPGGRIVSVNMGSNHYTPYTIISPTWVLDYFVINKFTDCRVGVAAILENGSFSMYSIDNDRIDRHHPVGNFVSPYRQAIIFVAEKGKKSSYNKHPGQEVYRSDQDWDVYEKRLRNFKKTGRDRILHSGVSESFVDNVPPGFKFEGVPLPPGYWYGM